MMMYSPQTYTILPGTVDFRPWSQDVKDQLTEGSCTANATCNAIELMMMRAGHPADLSVQQLYNSTRIFEGDLDKDQGCIPKDVLKVGMAIGIIDENKFPYDPKKVSVVPSIVEAHKITSYQEIALNPDSRVETCKILNFAIAEGYPVLHAFTAYNFMFNYAGSLPSQQLINTSAAGWNAAAGRHEWVLEGYGGKGLGYGQYGIQFAENSWGTSWGDKGFGISVNGFQDRSDRAYIITGFDGIDFNHSAQRNTVLELYIALFDRAPDQKGMDYWADKLVAGQSEQTVAQAINNCATQHNDNVQAITHFYSNILGRAPEQDGLEYWIEQLSTGETQINVASQIIEAALNYSGVDSIALASQALFKNKLAVSAYTAILCQNNNLNICETVLDHVTQDPNTVSGAQMWLAGQLTDHGWV